MDQATIVIIILSVSGAIGTTLLGAIGWGVKTLITTTFENTMALRDLSEKVVILTIGYDKLHELERQLNDLQRHVHSGSVKHVNSK
jgi:hypothetical protein